MRPEHESHQGTGRADTSERPGQAGAAGSPGSNRPVLTTRDLFALILGAYKTSLPYFLLIVLILIVITWLLTEVIFVS